MWTGAPQRPRGGCAACRPAPASERSFEQLDTGSLTWTCAPALYRSALWCRPTRLSCSRSAIVGNGDPCWMVFPARPVTIVLEDHVVAAFNSQHLVLLVLEVLMTTSRGGVLSAGLHAAPGCHCNQQPGSCGTLQSKVCRIQPGTPGPFAAIMCTTCPPACQQQDLRIRSDMPLPCTNMAEACAPDAEFVRAVLTPHVRGCAFLLAAAVARWLHGELQNNSIM